MKTIRTILATFGVTTLLYGLFAIAAMRLDFAFTGRSIYQLFRQTWFAALVLGIGCVLSFLIMTIAIVAFRDDGSRKKRDFLEEESEEVFLENETVSAEHAEEADESWSPEIKRKQRKALKAVEDPEPETPNLFDEGDEEPQPVQISLRGESETEEPDEAELPAETPEEPLNDGLTNPEPESAEALPDGKKRCTHCGAVIDADSAFCNCCGKRV